MTAEMAKGTNVIRCYIAPSINRIPTFEIFSHFSCQVLVTFLRETTIYITKVKVTRIENLGVNKTPSNKPDKLEKGQE